MKQIKFTRELSSGIQTLLLHKLRSFLTMLGVVFGVGSVVAMSGDEIVMAEGAMLMIHNPLWAQAGEAEEGLEGFFEVDCDFHGVTSNCGC
ncbi:MAG: hypothetical protein EOM10_10400 [Opitutae bacterium]|nr:hypothetical protein [Opitutae bacterium]